MTAAELITQALADAPTLRVEQDADGYLTIWDTDDRAVLQQRYLDTGSHEKDRAAIALLGLLLAAAPHIPAVLDAIGPDRSVALRDMRAAIRQAGEQL